MLPKNKLRSFAETAGELNDYEVIYGQKSTSKPVHFMFFPLLRMQEIYVRWFALTI